MIKIPTREELRARYRENFQAIIKENPGLVDFENVVLDGMEKTYKDIVEKYDKKRIKKQELIDTIEDHCAAIAAIECRYKCIECIATKLVKDGVVSE
jgi:hypothetical protein